MSKMMAFLAVMVVGGLMISQPAYAGGGVKHPPARLGKIQKHMKKFRGPGDIVLPRTTGRQRSIG